MGIDDKPELFAAAAAAHSYRLVRVQQGGCVRFRALGDSCPTLSWLGVQPCVRLSLQVIG